MFAVVCQHCPATVLTTFRIRQSEEEQLAAHLETRHPTVDYQSPNLGMLLIHYVVHGTPPDDGAVNFEPRTHTRRPVVSVSQRSAKGWRAGGTEARAGDGLVTRIPRSQSE
jgi:hypothetical protein